MALFIFNSENRIFLTLLSAVSLLIPLGLLNIAIYINSVRNNVGTDAQTDFWNRKVVPEKKYDLIFLGDSRVLTGIDPAVFENRLNCSAYNAAFAGGGLCEKIFRHTSQNLLSGKSICNSRVVVVGITPLTMSKDARKNSQFELLKNKLQKKSGNTFSEYVRIPFKKIRSKRIKEFFKRSASTRIYHKNGYLERFAKVSKKAQQSSLHTYTVFFKNYQYSYRSINELCHWIRQWNKEGITVFAFRPPVNKAMDSLEDESGKFNFSTVRKVVEQAGGIWLFVDKRDKYNSYDSSHLASAEAARLSRDLADKIRSHLFHRPYILPSSR